jgi:hypothetical protein
LGSLQRLITNKERARYWLHIHYGVAILQTDSVLQIAFILEYCFIEIFCFMLVEVNDFKPFGKSNSRNSKDRSAFALVSLRPQADAARPTPPDLAG